MTMPRGGAPLWGADPGRSPGGEGVPDAPGEGTGCRRPGPDCTPCGVGGWPADESGIPIARHPPVPRPRGLAAAERRAHATSSRIATLHYISSGGGLPLLQDPDPPPAPLCAVGFTADRSRLTADRRPLAAGLETTSTVVAAFRTKGTPWFRPHRHEARDQGAELVPLLAFVPEYGVLGSGIEWAGTHWGLTHRHTHL